MAALLVVSLLTFPSWSSAILRSIAMLQYSHSVMSHTQPSESAVQLAKLGLRLSPNETANSWVLARLAFLIGDYDLAWKSMKDLNPGLLSVLHWRDLLTSASAAGQLQATASLWEQRPFEIDSQQVRDYVAYAYLKQGLLHLEQGREDLSIQAFRTVQELRPGDLVSAYHLLILELQPADRYRDMLRHPTLLAVHPHDERILRLLSEFLPTWSEQQLVDKDVLARLLCWWDYLYDNPTYLEAAHERLYTACDSDGLQVPSDSEAQLRGIIASYLGVSATDIHLGPSQLAPMGSADVQQTDSEGWSYWVLADGVIENRALFATESFPYADNARRVIGVWTSLRPDLELARAGLVHSPLTVEPSVWLLSSFHYKTQDLIDGQVSVTFALPDEDLLGITEHLPATNGSWCRVVVIGGNATSHSQMIRPALWLWGTGSVTWTDVQLCEIFLPVGRGPSPHQSLVQILCPASE
jgi:hypothetical protein